MKGLLEEEGMLKKLPLYFLVTLAVMVLLVSCQRSASQAPVTSEATPTQQINTPVPGVGTPLSQIEIIQTQTAVSEETAMATPVISMPTPTAAGSSISITVVPPTGTSDTPTPETTPIIIVPVATPGIPATYTLQKGEQPYCIARRFNVNQYDLITLNGLNTVSATNLPEGYVLTIPQNGNPFIGPRTLVAHPATFTVSSANDTVYSIACYYGDIDPSQIIAANSLVAPYTLHINQVLTIP
jgi:LysM repeat protein